MISFMCFVLPGFISLQCENILLNRENQGSNLILKYGIYALLINTITMTILTYCFNIVYDYQESINLYPAIAIKYAVISIIIAIVLSIIKVIIVKNLKVRIEVESK